MGEMAVETHELTRIYGSHMAVNRVSLRIPPGTVMGFLGQNGAGKSTTIKMLLGLIHPSAGEARLLGHDSRNLPPDIWRRVGVVTEDPKMPPWMTIRQMIAFTRSCYAGWDDAYAETLRTSLELPPDRKIHQLSRGMQEKIALLLALAFRPELLVLDDPVSGLDPIVRHEFLEQVIALVRKEGHTVLFSSHIIDEVERIAQQIVIIRQGAVLVDQSLEDLRNTLRRLTVAARPEKVWANLPGVVRVQEENTQVILTVKAWTPDWPRKVGLDAVQVVKTEEVDLSTIFLDYIKGA